MVLDKPAATDVVPEAVDATNVKSAKKGEDEDVAKEQINELFKKALHLALSQDTLRTKDLVTHLEDCDISVCLSCSETLLEKALVAGLEGSCEGDHVSPRKREGC